MSDFKQLFDILLRDVSVELTDEFDQNFLRKAFFTDSWKPTKMQQRNGSLMLRTGALRQSIGKPTLNSLGKSIKWNSSLPYADIHNSGGEITVTTKMKKYFWYRYMQMVGKGKKAKIVSPEALYTRNLACMKVGTKIKIPKRQFIGDHPVVKNRVDQVTKEWVQNDLKNSLTQHLKSMM